MMLVRRIVSEPLVHFLLIGLAVFFFYKVANPETEPLVPGKRVEVTIGEAQQLIAQFRNTWGRAPSLEELQALLEAKLKQSILVREASALAMDQDDAVIERRLAQKMTFFITSAAGSVVPEEDDLKAFFAEHADQFAERPKMSFRQVYLGEDLEKAASAPLIDALNSGADPSSVGRQTMLPAEVGLSPEPTVDGIFGTGFFQALLHLEPGKWSGPVQSGFGSHAIFLTGINETRPASYEAVRDRVFAAYKEQQAQSLSESIYGEIRAGYDITMPNAAVLMGLLQ